MLVEKSGVSFGEDAVSSTYYTTGSNTDSSGSSSFTSGSTSSSSASQKNSGRAFSLPRFFNWFGFGTTEEQKQDKDTVDEIMKCFRSNDIAGMEKFICTEITIESGRDIGFWWDDGTTEVPKPKPAIKGTPHPKKLLKQLPPKVRKAVRFELDNTPEEKQERPFTPLFTSTPKHCEAGDESGEDDLPPLREVDSNTVVNPSAAHNNTSSILLANTSVMNSWHKTREETTSALRLASKPHLYKICYDDTDEEEVVEEVPNEEPSSSRQTFVIATTRNESDSDNKSTTLHEQSFDMELDTSTDSSVVLGLDRIEDYIRALEDEIIAANQFAREKDVIRARGAVRHAKVLQERIGQMQDAINEMCGKLGEGDQKNMSAAFEDSCWSAAQLNLESGSFDANQL